MKHISACFQFKNLSGVKFQLFLRYAGKEIRTYPHGNNAGTVLYDFINFFRSNAKAASIKRDYFLNTVAERRSS